MKRSTGTFRSRLEIELDKSKQLMRDSRTMSSSKVIKVEKSNMTVGSKLFDRKMTESNVFVPFENERDRLGRLKDNRIRIEPPAIIENKTSNELIAKSRRKSIYTNVKDELSHEPLDLDKRNGFKVVDGFERQANIIVRNKEFMKFLNEEKSNNHLSRNQENRI